MLVNNQLINTILIDDMELFDADENMNNDTRAIFEFHGFSTDKQYFPFPYSV